MYSAGVWFFSFYAARASAKTCQLPVETDLDLHKFRIKYHGKKPVFISGGAVNWTKGFNWSKDAFIEAFGSFNVTVRDRPKIAIQGGFAPALRRVGVEDFLNSTDTKGVMVFESHHMPLSLALREKLDARELPVADVRMKPIVSFGGKVAGHIFLVFHELSISRFT